jgi:hypothetical protein
MGNFEQCKLGENEDENEIKTGRGIYNFKKKVK